MSIRNRLIACFQTVLPFMTPEEIEQASYACTPKWDSMATMVLIGTIELQFKVRFTAGDIERLDSFEHVLDRLFTLLQEKQAHQTV